MKLVFRPNCSLSVRLCSPPNRVSVIIRFSEKVQDDLHAQVDTSLTLFVAAVNLGFFPIAGVSPSLSSTTLSGTVWKGESEQYYHLETKNMDVQGFRILLAMLKRLQEKMNGISEISFFSERREAVSVGADNLLQEDAFPSLFQSVPFFVERKEGLVFEFERVVQVKFFGKPTSEIVDQVTALFETWNAVVESGGYADSQDNLLKESLYRGETYMLSKNILEHTIDRFDAAEEAFSGLLNALVKIHETTASIKEVIIE